jgi:hypothetical protein
VSVLLQVAAAWQGEQVCLLRAALSTAKELEVGQCLQEEGQKAVNALLGWLVSCSSQEHMLMPGQSLFPT